MGKKVDLTGQKFGRLTAIKDTGKRGGGGNAIWLCKCDCGNETKELLQAIGSSKEQL